MEHLRGHDRRLRSDDGPMLLKAYFKVIKGLNPSERNRLNAAFYGMKWKTTLADLDGKVDARTIQKMKQNMTSN